MGRQAAVVLYAPALVTVVAGVDILFFRHHFLARLIVNVGIVLVFAALVPPGGRLVGFLWGTPKVFGASRNWSFRDLGLQLPRAGSRPSPRRWPAVDCQAPVLA
jgi:hypothetical protein